MKVQRLTVIGEALGVHRKVVGRYGRDIKWVVGEI